MSYKCKHTKVMKWWWNDNDDTHHFDVKSEKVETPDSLQSTSVSAAKLPPSVQVTLPPFEVRAVSQLKWDNKPVITWSKIYNDSEQYWAWTTTATVPLPRSLLGKDNLEVNFALEMYTDKQQPYGRYSQPGNITVDLQGFGAVHQQKLNPPVVSGGRWYTQLLIVAQTAFSETFPVPHFVIRFTTENFGGVQGSVNIDWDVVLNVVISAVVARQTLRAIE